MSDNKESEIIITKCPHCQVDVVIYKKDIKCAIFRHGVKKKTMKQINQHAKKKVCDFLANNNLIYGCGKPFRLQNGIAVICDYV